MSATYYLTLSTEKTKSFFKKDSWYRGVNGDSGIIAKFSGDVESNFGWWGSSNLNICNAWVYSATPMSNTVRMVSPENWKEITSKHEIAFLNRKQYE